MKRNVFYFQAVNYFGHDITHGKWEVMFYNGELMSVSVALMDEAGNRCHGAGFDFKTEDAADVVLDISADQISQMVIAKLGFDQLDVPAPKKAAVKKTVPKKTVAPKKAAKKK